MRYKILTILLVVLLAAIAISFLPERSTDENAKMDTRKVSATYLWFDNTRPLVSQREIELDSFPSGGRNGSLIWIDHHCFYSNPDIIGGWSARKILIQLPQNTRQGSKYDIFTSGSASISSRMLDGQADAFIFDEPGDIEWLSDRQNSEYVYKHGRRP